MLAYRRRTRAKNLRKGAGRVIDHASYSRKLKNYRKAVRLEKKADKANVEALFQKSMADNPQAASNPLSRWKQRQEIKKQYAAAKSARSAAAGAKSAGGTAKGTKKAARGAGTILERLKEFAVRHSHALWLVLIFAFLLMMISGMFSSCSAMLEGGTGIRFWGTFLYGRRMKISSARMMITGHWRKNCRDRLTGLKQIILAMTNTVTSWTRLTTIPTN